MAAKKWLVLVTTACAACSIVPVGGDGGASNLSIPDTGARGGCDAEARLVLYPDCDGDGDGSAATIPYTGCSPPLGRPLCDGAVGTWVTTHGDCDDLQSEVSSLAHELCNFADDDCDGEIDEEPETSAGGCAGFLGHVAAGTCVEHRCVRTECEPGWDHCGGGDDGCGTSLMTDPTSCGGCGRLCPTELSACISGRCAAP